MYLKFYQLTQEPFHITPDPAFLYPSPTHRQALASIFYGVAKRKGFIAITGEVGVGKTTVLRTYLEKTDPERQTIIHTFNPSISYGELLQTICRELALSIRTDSITAMFDAIHRDLIEKYKRGMNVILIVDEAQNVPIETLENIRMLSNLETAKDKLMQIVLIGQPEFQAKLDRHELRQLKQRIGIRAKILPLSREESLAYIDHRLATANSRGAAVFTKDALRLIVKEAGGIPRVMNILCSGALIAGLGYMKKPVSAAIVKEVIADYHGRPKRAFFRWQYAAVAGFLALAGLFLMTPYKSLFSSKSPNPAPAQPSHSDAATKEKIASDTEALSKPSDSAATPDIVKKSANPGDSPLLPKTTKEEATNHAGSLPVDAETTSRGPIETSLSAVFRTEPPPIASNNAGGSGLPRLGETTGSKEAPKPGDARKDSVKQQDDRVTVTVQKGQTVTDLITQYCGSADARLIEWVKAHNPQITDANRIWPGDVIILPKNGESEKRW